MSGRSLQHAITAPGYVFGQPTGQAAGTPQFLSNVSGGQENPQSVADWMRGITFGLAPRKAPR